MKSVREKKKNLIIRLGVFAFAAYVAVSLVSLQMEISAKQAEYQVIAEQVGAQETANKDLERQLSLGDDKAFLARIARDKLDLGRPDERVFRDGSGS